MQQIHRRTPIPKCDFSEIALHLYWNHCSAWVFSCKFAAFLKSTCIPRNISGELLKKPKWIIMIAILKLKLWSYDVISPHRCMPTLTHLLLIFVTLIIEFFEWEKENTAAVTFKQVSITCRWIIHILWRNYRYSTLCEQTCLV